MQKKIRLVAAAAALLAAAACDREPDRTQIPQSPDPSLNQGASTGPSVILAPTADTQQVGPVDPTLLPDTLPRP